MADTKQRQATDEELEQDEAQELPDREEMSLINANVAVPVDAAVSANVLTDKSVANAQAPQDVPITQQPNLKS